MPDLSLTPGQELLRNTARDFVERECTLAMVRRIAEDEGGFSRELWQKLAGLGWCGILVPPEHGGEGGSLTDAAVLMEQMGRALLPGPFHSSAVIGSLLLRETGSAEQRQRLLPALARGETVLALALTEADHGWEPSRIHTTATRENGGYRIDGVKQYVHDAAAAHELVVVARTGDASDALTLFLVPREAAGVTLRPMRGFSGDPLFEITFDGVQVAAGRVVGEVDGGWRTLEPVLDRATALLCAYVAGASRRVYEMTMDYAQHRVQFGQPIARFQRVQDRLIDMVNATDAARWTAYEAVWKLEQGKPDAAVAVAVAKTVANEGFYRLCEDAHHVHAGVGSDKAYGLYLFTQLSRSFYHYLGDPTFHRRRLAQLLGL